MKKAMIAAACGLFALPITAQQDVRDYNQKSLYETLTKIEKKTDRFNFYLNMHNSFNAGWNDGKFSSAAFKMDQLRLEAKGNINDWISYRWRQRLNRSNNGSGSQDNLPASIDYAAVAFKLTPRFTVNAGKQCTTYGGIEFDLNPIEIYQFSDMCDYMRCFMTGVNLIYDAVPTQQFCLQILDSQNGKFADIYTVNPDKYKQSKAALLYTFNWNGSFFDGAYKTRWSASYMDEATRFDNKTDKTLGHCGLWYYALGNDITLGKLNVAFDWMYAREALDRLGVLTEFLNSGQTLTNTKYMSYVCKVNYRLTPKWNLFVKGMLEDEGTYRASAGYDKGKYRTAYGYLGGVEYYPMNENLRFFMTYIGRHYDYTDIAKAHNLKDYSTNTLSVGFIYQLKMF
jgi:hypothetical protein